MVCWRAHLVHLCSWKEGKDFCLLNICWVAFLEILIQMYSVYFEKWDQTKGIWANLQTADCNLSKSN